MLIQLAKQLKHKKEHNQAILEITSALSYLEFDDTKGCVSAKRMWDALQKIYGGEMNVLIVKDESLRVKFDEMRIKDGGTIVHYCGRIKDIVNSI